MNSIKIITDGKTFDVYTFNRINKKYKNSIKLNCINQSAPAVQAKPY